MLKRRMYSVEYKSEYGGEWPLTEKELSVLDTDRESLVDLIDCSELVVRLYSAKVINVRQREMISSEQANHRRNEALLDILRRHSINDYKKVVRCLNESNQSHVAETLDKGGGKFSTSSPCLNVCVCVCMHVCEHLRRYACIFE